MKTSVITRFCRILTVFGCCLAFTQTGIYAQANPTRPNIVIILADDLGYGDPGVYNAESKIPTPNIDELASQGLLFTDAHSGSAVCTPTRYGVVTGRYAWRTSLKSGVLWSPDPCLIEEGRNEFQEFALWS